MKTIVTSSKPWGEGDIAALRDIFCLPIKVHRTNQRKVIISGPVGKKIFTLGIRQRIKVEKVR